jgi:hypothetical protein
VELTSATCDIWNLDIRESAPGGRIDMSAYRESFQVGIGASKR